MPPRLRVQVACATGEPVSANQSKDTTWSWLAQRMLNGSGRSPLSPAETSEVSFVDSLNSSSTQQEVCLSPLSQYFCNVEQPPDIYAIMTLDGYCTLQELVRPMQKMADLHDRFKRRLVYRFGAWQAEYLDDFDVQTLMRDVTLDGQDAQLAFDEYMGKLMSSDPLGADGIPPWDVTCIHYTNHPHRTDVLMRASHIIGDGQLFMKLIKQIMDPQNAEAEADFAATVLGCSTSSTAYKSAVQGQGLGEVHTGNSSSECEEVCGKYSSSSSSSGSTCEQCSEGGSVASCSSGAEDDQPQQLQLQSPGVQVAKAAVEQHSMKQQQQQQQQKKRRQGGGNAVQTVGSFLWMLWRLLCLCWHGLTALLFTAWQPFSPADPVTAVKASAQDCTGPRKWSSVSLKLAEFHCTAKLLGLSINTLAVSCLSGGIRRYILKHGDTPAKRVRLCSMVDTRSMPGLLTGTDGNSNNFSFIGVPLFTGDCSAVERAKRVGWSLSWIRHSLAVPLAIRMPSIINFLFRHPKWSCWVIQWCLPSKATVGFSNMRGPAGQWTISGYPVARIHNGVQPNSFGCFISLFSYSNTLTFTHTCYASKTDNPQMLLDCIVQEYEALQKAAVASHVGSGGSSGPGTPGSQCIIAG